MFGFFKRKKKEEEAGGKPPRMLDLEGEPLAEGDEVMSYRYDLGRCRVVRVEGVPHYESLEQAGQRVAWSRMIDAATGFQKVKKLG